MSVPKSPAGIIETRKEAIWALKSVFITDAILIRKRKAKKLTLLRQTHNGIRAKQHPLAPQNAFMTVLQRTYHLLPATR